MKNLKTILSIFLILLVTTNGFSQTEGKDVSITASGSGKTQEEAKQSALRSATEQAFGAFISSKTEMFNDQVVADQMSSVSSGNIKSYEVLNESQLPDGSWGVTLKAIVSVDKLTSFVEAKGVAIEIKGGMFALNIKQQSLNELGEVKAVSEMVGLLHEPMQLSFDYVIKSSDPKSLDAENKNWAIPIEVTATVNKNMGFCAHYCIKTLSALSLSAEEVTSYQSLNKAVFSVEINYNGVAKTFYLRKQSSINTLYTLTSQWDFYTRLFTVQTGMDESNGFSLDPSDNYGNNGRIRHNFAQRRLNRNDEYDKIYINFLDTGKIAATFSWQDKRTLSQIEQMTGYKVGPRGVVSQFKHGGFVVYEVPTIYRIGVQMESNESNVVKLPSPGGIAEKAGMKPGDKIISINDIQVVVEKDISEYINKSEKENKLCEFKIERAGEILTLAIYPALVTGFGLVAAITDLGSMYWNSAKPACDELILNGYSDWHLPSKAELNYVYVYLKQFGVGGFADTHYWSSTEYNEFLAWSQNFGYGGQYESRKNDYNDRDGRYQVRAVRAF
jgi:hypothetical protein